MNGALLVRVLRERWRGLAGWTGGLVALVTIQISVYPTIRDSRQGWADVTEDFPEAFRQIFRIEDYTSPKGYLSTELFSFMVPLIFIGIAATWGARAGAEEEENGTADVLLSLPVSRSAILATRSVGVLVTMGWLALVSVVSLVVGTHLADMAVGTDDITRASFVCGVLGCVFGSVSLAGACWTGRRGVGLGCGLGLAIAMFVFYSLAPLVSAFDALLPVNPFDWTIGQSPLSERLNWWTLSESVAATALLSALGFMGYERRDMRV